MSLLGELKHFPGYIHFSWVCGVEVSVCVCAAGGWRDPRNTAVGQMDQQNMGIERQKYAEFQKLIVDRVKSNLQDQGDRDHKKTGHHVDHWVAANSRQGSRKWWRFYFKALDKDWKERKAFTRTEKKGWTRLRTELYQKRPTWSNGKSNRPNVHQGCC